MTNQFIEQQQELVLSLEHEVDEDDNWISTDGDIANIVRFIITNTGEELMRLAEGERKREIATSDKDSHFKCLERGKERGNNKAIDTLKKHITNVTGVEPTDLLEKVKRDWDKQAKDLLDN